MMDMVERVARGMYEAEPDAHRFPDWDKLMAGDEMRGRFLRRARAAIEASGYAALEAAIRTIQSVIPGYLKQKMTAEDFALIVIGAVDSKAVNQASEKGR